ncbi:nucleotidyl transferase AbiEii/AbiGii toxin family protein [Telluribacter sp.]|jgi:predicted nucleotidyltransferase|uniref:nucleotidyl transferase AbiEii/AbiGii toxin family protein n=1 Tax=Telluribacter sp. TaxID=1978767 RepID=UPI002E110C14|nr:nucleotidyl transferase AbiEii/AbiGii toxin family protein [Telluribacter sp.]
MNTYRLNYRELRQNPTVAGLLSGLERGFSKFGIDFYLVGAVARDAWMSIHDKKARRTTGDIDFAVLINKASIYEALKEYLIQHEGFSPSKENAFVLIWKDKTQVDLLPFGAIADDSGTVRIEGSGFASVSMPGFDEIYAAGLPELILEEQHQFKFCTLPGIVLLKLIAWDDRPEARRDDIKDISDILQHFFDLYDHEIWDNHADLFDNENDNLRHIAARVMGREIQKITQRNAKLSQRVQTILDANTADAFTSEMARIMVEYFDNTLEENVLLLKQIEQGLLE